MAATRLDNIAATTWWALDVRTKKELLEEAAEQAIGGLEEGAEIPDYQAFYIHQVLGAVIRGLYDLARADLESFNKPKSEFNHSSFTGYRNHYKIDAPTLRRWLKVVKESNVQTMPIFGNLIQ